jgi:hypothetical protein
MKNVIESVEDQNHNNKRKMYQTVNQFKKGYQNKFSIIRNKKGELAMNPGAGENFRNSPDRPWGPPRLLYNAY